MKSNFLLTKLMLLLCLLVGSVNGAWAADPTGTITFGSSNVKIDAASVNGNDDLGNSWTITTVGTTSFTPNAAYYQVGASKKPATSITFTTTLAADQNITAFSAKFGGFSGTAGNVTLKVGDTTVGAGSLNATNDVTVSSTKSASGKVLTVTVTGISKGVKCYHITYTYADASDTRAQTTVTINASGITNTNVFVGTAAGSLSAIVKAGEAAIDGATVTWESENTDVATISPDGTVTLVGAGETVITASYAGDAENYKPSTDTYALNVDNYDPSVPGTITNPYTVAEVINGTATGNGIYVKGFIVGCYKNNSFTNSDLSVDSNLALADDADETTNVIPVELPSGSDRRTAFNVVDHPYNVGVAQILYKGNAKSYFGEKGVKGALVGTQKIAEKIDISAAGMATYYTDCALDFNGLTDMYAYIVTKDGSNYSLTRVNKVPAETGLLLYNPNGGAASNVVPVLTEAIEDFTDNALTGTLTEITAGANDYILNNGVEGVGFYKGNGQKIGVHKAYLSAGAGARPFFLINFDSEATGISFVGREASMNNRFFNLKGQQVKTPQKGLYIVNGKKVIVK